MLAWEISFHFSSQWKYVSIKRSIFRYHLQLGTFLLRACIIYHLITNQGHHVHCIPLNVILPLYSLNTICKQRTITKTVVIWSAVLVLTLFFHAVGYIWAYIQLSQKYRMCYRKFQWPWCFTYQLIEAYYTKTVSPYI